MSRFTVSPAGFFITRPLLGDVYRPPTGCEYTVAASWDKGVVFEGGHRSASPEQLMTYTFIRASEVLYASAS